MITINNDGAAKFLCDYCNNTHHWEVLNSILLKYLGCEIQRITYNDIPLAFLRLTDKNVIFFVEFKKLPREYHPVHISVEITTPDGHVSIKADVLKWKNNEPSWMLYSGWGTPDNTKEVLYKKVIKAFMIAMWVNRENCPLV